jgi:hypothetical protein
MIDETTFNRKLLWMLHGARGAVFSKRAPLVRKKCNEYEARFY